MDHIAIQVHDIAASAAFYDAVLAPLGGGRKKQFGENISFGVTGHPLWLVPATESAPARELHIAFAAADRTAVDAFYAAALAVGAEVISDGIPFRWSDRGYRLRLQRGWRFELEQADVFHVMATTRHDTPSLTGLWITLSKTCSPACPGTSGSVAPAARELTACGSSTGHVPRSDPGIRICHYTRRGHSP